MGKALSSYGIHLFLFKFINYNKKKKKVKRDIVYCVSAAEAFWRYW